MAGGKLANLVGPGEATSATNVDTREGVIKALYGPGSTVSALSASKQHLHYEDNLGWYDATEDSWHTYDSKGNGGTYSFFNVGSTPYYSNGTSHQKALGLTAPGSATTQTTGGGTARYFRYTYGTNGTTYAPMESNT